MKTILSIHDSKTKKLLSLVLATTLFGGALIGTRFYITGHITYLFFVWNIFLAFVPYVLGKVIVHKNLFEKHHILALVFLGTWLLFLPNAFYIVTDLFHLKARHAIPLWYDLLLIFTFAWNGLLLGFISLTDLHFYLQKLQGERLAWFHSLFTLVLCAFGVYLGRFLRWNSWDLIIKPEVILYDAASLIWPINAHNPAIGFTITYSLFFILGFITFKTLRDGQGQIS